jgi:organic hydroperoxide reductase OsmC/OhrA
VSVRPKLRHYAVAVDAEGRPTQEAGGSLTWEEKWTPEHLVLAALARCSLVALDYHARRESLSTQATARAAGVVGPRPNGSWGFVEIACEIDATITPAPAAGRLPALAARAERGCFVGQSLEPRPEYKWTINGEEIP